MGEPLPYEHGILMLAIGVAAFSAYTDWRRAEIPNRLTYTALLIGPPLHVAHAVAAHESLETCMLQGGGSLLGAFVCALVPALMYRQGAIGGGDVKLLAGQGALLQAMMGIEAEMYGFFAAALLAPAILAYRGTLFVTLKNALGLMTNVFLPKPKRRVFDSSAHSWMPLGPPLLFGVALTAYLHW